MQTLQSSKDVSGSFRDPSGFLFKRDGILFRQVNQFYHVDYNYLLGTGLHRDLVKDKLLIASEEVYVEPYDASKAYKVMKPEVIPFISYPYEWCFSQLKDAALLTLKIEKIALEHGMTLKDASAYNVQFKNGKPIFIDTLSFKKYQEGEPWKPYGQFCQHFLAPLALMHYKDIRLNQLFRIYMDGVPLDLASELLPLKAFCSIPIVTGIHIHAKSMSHFSKIHIDKSDFVVPLSHTKTLINSLESAVNKLTWKSKGTEWAEYYNDNNYTESALEHKKQIVSDFLDRIKPKSVWDLGGNVGMFSHIASRKGIPTISFDNDPVAIERSYRICTLGEDPNILPLLVDLANPSSGIGWASKERMSLLERGPADTVMALALIHHLTISYGIPLSKVADFFSDICNSLIIEYIPKEDSKVQLIATNKEDIFLAYNQEEFERAFGRHFKTLDKVTIKESKRVMYLMGKN